MSKFADDAKDLIDRADRLASLLKEAALEAMFIAQMFKNKEQEKPEEDHGEGTERQA